jgi:hypothetical protein
MKFDDATLSTLFIVANALPLPVWLLMMFLPSWRVTQTVVRSRITSVLISILFVVLNVLFFSTVMEDKFEVEGFFSLDIIAHAFKNRFVVLLCWIHYLAFDLLVGSWMFLDNYDNDRPVPQLLMIPIFVLTFAFGPAGFLLYVLCKVLFSGKWIWAKSENKQKEN